MNTPLGFKSPNSILNISSPTIESLHPFGCLAWYKVPEANQAKLDPKARLSILLSYLSDGNGFSLWDVERKVVIKSRNVIFDHSTFPYGSLISPSTELQPILVELPWPDSTPVLQPIPDIPFLPVPVPATNSCPLPFPLTMPQPLLNTFTFDLTPSDRRLQASIHAPDSPFISSPVPQHPKPNDTPANPQLQRPGSALPALTGQTRQFKQCSNSCVRLVVGQALSDQSTCRRVGQACPISSWDRSQRTSRDRAAPSSLPLIHTLTSSGPSSAVPNKRHLTRLQKIPDRYDNWARQAVVCGEADKMEAPKMWKQLLKLPNKSWWLKAADDEFALLTGMETWNLVPRPAKRKIIKSKWVFKVKRNSDHSIQKLKGWLVAMGYSQIHSVD
ncbi:hypothetical protein PCANC_10604 [Puccinia coronata f. sp. avenae]|uniref:Retroviral polymerase SH3-like domain-containing protein n=1 Tax=Puccinia coronata f. sp. avenae TaxID=200324 RepID=A0A2N5VR64_9BASI|nr:hypothetical protein PCANC_10604 [Puccinia coronata f. sp. avenae]